MSAVRGRGIIFVNANVFHNATPHLHAVRFRTGGEAFTALLIMAIGSTMLTVPVVHPKLKALKSLVGKAS